jgi:integrase
MRHTAASSSAVARVVDVARSAWTRRGWDHLDQWLQVRLEMPIGTLLRVVGGPTAARPWLATAARATLRDLAISAGVRRRLGPQQLRHAHAVEMAHEGIPLPIIQRQLGHAHLGVTSIYLQEIATREIVHTIHHRRPPVIPASAGLRP